MPPCSGANDGQKIWWGQWDGYDYEMECKEVFVDGQWPFRWQWTGNRKPSQGCRPGGMRE
jgi:hypothetical protein